MPNRRPPYARTLAVLRVLAWPYQYPPLSWLVALNNWVAASNARLTAAVIVAVLVVAWAVIAHA